MFVIPLVCASACGTILLICIQFISSHPSLLRIAVIRWTDLSADGQTDMGKALSILADEMKMPPMSERALPPVLVLISDGQPTDNFEKGLKQLLAQPWGKKAVRIAIAIGEDADT